MKKIIFLILTLLLSFTGFSQEEGFEGSTVPNLVTNQWSLGSGIWGVFDNGVGLTRSWNVNSGVTTPPVPPLVHSGSNAAYMDRENIGAGNTSQDFLATPVITVPINGQLRFWTRSTLSGDSGTKYKILVAPGTAAQDDVAAYTTEIQMWTESTLTTVFNVYEEKVVDLSAYPAGTQIYIAFVMEFTQPTVTLAGDRWLIDDFRIVSRCLDPTNLDANFITQTTAVLSWDNPSGATEWEIEILPFATPPTENGIIVNTNSYLATETTTPAGVDFTPTTQYKFFVRAICTGDVPSEWIGPFAFTTSSPGLTCNSPIVVASPLPYSTTDNTGAYGDSTDVSQGNCVPGFTNYMVGNDVFYSFTPTETGAVTITLSPTGDSSGIFVYETCDNVGGTCVAGVANAGTGIREIECLLVTAGTQYIIVISTDGFPQTVEYTLTMQECNCAPPADLSAVSTGPTSANLSWGNPGGATSWEIFVQNPGASIPTTAGETTTDNTEFAIDSLSDGTPLVLGCYQYWVRADCGDGTFSPWAGPYQFCTTTCTEGCNFVFTMVDSFGDSWNGNTISIIQSGNTIATLTGPTDEQGQTPIDQSVALCAGEFTVFWNTGGAFANEVGLTVTNSFGQVLFEKVPNANVGSQGSVLYTGTVDCLVPLCLPPTNLTSSNVGTYGATLDWVPNGPLPVSWEIVALPVGSPLPTPATTPMFTVAGNLAPPYTVPNTLGSGLLADTEYVYYVRAVCASGGANDWSNASPSFTTLPTCPKPTGLTLTAPTMTSIVFSWTAGGSETAWQYIYLPAGSPAPASGDSGWVDSTTNNVVVGGLDSGTLYDFYVIAVCDPTDSSTVGAPATGSTTICQPEDQCLTTFVMVDSFGDSWNGNTMSVLQNGIVVGTLTGPTNEDNQTPISVQIALCNGIPFELFWNTGGAFANEVGVTIINSFNQTLFIKVPNAGVGEQGTTLFSGPVNCDQPLCMPPTNITIDEIDLTSAKFEWTIGGAEVAWQVIALPTGSPAPTDASPWVSAPTNPFVLGGLTAGTTYDFYIRALCDGNDPSVPSTPFTFNTAICPLAEQCLYTFEMWDSFGDSWNGNTMAVIQNGVTIATLTGPTNDQDQTHIFQTISVCDGVPLELFWNNGGAFANEVGVSIISFLDEVIFTKNPGTGTQGTLLFSAEVNCTPPTCPKPINLTTDQASQTSVILDWDETGTATQWEIVIVDQGATAPGASPANVIDAAIHPILITGLISGHAYSFYVRAICTLDPLDDSNWAGPSNFFTLPANDECAGAIFVPVNSNSTCNQLVSGTVSGATASTTPIAPCTGVADDDVWFQFIATNSYLNISLSSLVGSTTNINHAVYSGGCDGLTLLYCSDPGDLSTTANGLIEDNVYYIRVWSSGTNAESTTFNLCISTPSTCENSSTVCNTTYTNTVGVTSLGTIGCLFSSPNPTFFTIQIVGSGPINYLLTQSTTPGGPPNLDVDYAAWGPFNTQAEVCALIDSGGAPLTGLTTGCSYSAAPTENFNIASAVAGQFYVILITNFSNQPGTISLQQTNSGQTGAGVTFCCEDANFSYSPTAYCIPTDPNPVPVIGAGALAGTFSASPAGLVFVDVTTGEVDLDNSLPGTYVITNTLPATTSCEIRDFDFTITLSVPAAATISYSAPAYCSNDTTVQQVTFAGTPGGSYSVAPPGLFIDTVTGAITPNQSAPGNYTVTYNIGSAGVCTSQLPSVAVEIIASPTIPTIVDVTACESYQLPILAAGNYFTGPNGTGNPLAAGDLISEDQLVYVYFQAGICSGETSFTVTINNAPVIAPIDDVTTCDTYFLPVLPLGNYFSGLDGTGTAYNAGDEITSDITLYVYATDGICGTNEPFTITFGEFVILPIADVTACGEYILPTLAVGNYFAQTGGVSPITNTTITQTQTIYVYGESGTCNDEEIFIVTINPIPVVVDVDDVVSCGPYTLPTLAVGNYYTADNGGGTIIPQNSQITTNQTVYVYAETGTAPNICFDGDSFMVTINNPITLVPIADVTQCTPYTLPALTLGNYFTAPNGVGPFQGNTVNSTQTIYVYAESGSCNDEESFVVTIGTAAAFTVNGGCQGSNYVLEAIGGPFDPSATYAWTSVGGSFVGGTDGPTATVSGAGEYTLTITTNGCPSSDSFDVDTTGCTIQKGISANGDGVNDTFDLTGQNVTQLQIFNRYGMVVYKKQNYSNEWAGQSDKGEELPDGTYYYVIERASGETITGWIYINRDQN